MRRLVITALVLASGAALIAQAPARPTPVFTADSRGNGPLDRLWFRPIGPATPSGRVDDLAVLESVPTTFYVAMATAGIYKTTNAGTTFTSVFDNEGSGSVGAVAIAPTQAKANDVAEMVQNAFAQVQTIQQQTRNQTLPPNAKQELDGIVKEFENVRRRLGLGQQGGFSGGGFGGGADNLRGRIGQLKGQVMAATALPTNTQLMQIRDVRSQLPGLIDPSNAVVAKVPGLVKNLINAGVIFPAVKPVPKA